MDVLVGVEWMNKYKGYLIDLDGTLYRGSEVITEALSFMERIVSAGIPYLYLTNNSSKCPGQVAEHLKNFGFPAEPRNIYTSALATAQYVQEHFPKAKAFVIGEEGLQIALKEAGISFADQEPQVVIVGIDRSFDYKKLKKASLAIQNGAVFIGTNGDRVLPTEEGFLPGSGTLNMAVEMASGQNPIFIGKPEPIILHYAMERLGTKPEETLIVGDNMDTDILAGIRGGVDTLLVTTGVTSRELAEKSVHPPTYIVEDLDQWKV